MQWVGRISSKSISMNMLSFMLRRNALGIIIKSCLPVEFDGQSKIYGFVAQLWAARTGSVWCHISSVEALVNWALDMALNRAKNADFQSGCSCIFGALNCCICQINGLGVLVFFSQTVCNSVVCMWQDKGDLFRRVCVVT